jgi:hypothetical protein
MLEVHSPHRTRALGMGNAVLDEAGLQALGGELLRAKRAREEASLVPGGLELDQPHS